MRVEQSEKALALVGTPIQFRLPSRYPVELEHMAYAKSKLITAALYSLLILILIPLLAGGRSPQQGNTNVLFANQY